MPASGQRSLTRIPAPAILVAGMAAAAAAMPTPRAQVALVTLGVVGALLTPLLARSAGDRRVAADLGNLMLLGAAARFFAMALIYRSVGPLVLAPDAGTYEQLGAAAVNAWVSDASLPPRLLNSLQVGYPYINAALFLVFGVTPVAPATLNALLSVWTAIPIYSVTRMVTKGSEAAARRAAILVIFFPSMILWSVLNIREAPTILVIALGVMYLMRFQQRAHIRELVGIIGSLVALAFFREYMSILIGASATMGILVGRSRAPLRSFLAGASLLVGLTFVVQSLGVGGTLVSEPSLQTVQALREDMTRGAGSAYGTEYTVSTPGEALTFLPVGLVYFLFAPFPWALGSLLQTFALPETLIWYGLVPFVAWGAVLAVRHDFRSHVLLFAVLVVVTFAYALVQGNVGTAFRHRAQILPLFFVFGAIGLQDAWALWVARRRRTEEVRRRITRGQAGRLPARPPGG